MGSVVTYRCEACRFSSDRLSVGWSKGHRAEFRGRLALCARCEQLMVVNLVATLSVQEDRPCVRCGTLLTMIGGTADSIRCPHCTRPLQRTLVSVWP